MERDHDRARDRKRMMTLAIAAGLFVAACGGDDDEPAAEPAAESAEDAADVDAEPAGEQGSDDGGSGGDGGDATSRDDVQQSLDDAGVDLDLEELEETMSGFSTGEGGGVVTIDGVSYTFEATAVCLVQGSDFVAEGLGTGPDGSPAWVSISASQEDLDGDGTEGNSIDVFVEPGRTELFGDGPDDAPDFSASYWDGFGDASSEIVYELADGRITGGGPVQDFNGVAWPFGESREMTFEASCG